MADTFRSLARRPRRIDRRVAVGLLLLLALAPAPASASPRPALAVRYPAHVVAGADLQATVRVPSSIARGATVRLELRRGRRWVVVARAAARPGHALTLRFATPARASSVVLRLRLMRHGKLLAATRARSVALRRPSTGRGGAPRPHPGLSGGGQPPGGAPPLALDGTSTVVAPGSVAAVDVPPPVSAVSQLRLDSASAGMSVAAQPSGFAVAADAAAAPGARTLQLSGVGCVGGDCGTAFTLTLPVTVRTLAAPFGELEGFTSPSPDRLAAGTAIGAGAVELADELTVTLGTPDAPGDRSDAETVAAQVGGVVSGGLEQLGVYEIRWTSPQDLAARSDELSALPGVAAVARATPGLTKTDALPPGDWDGDGPQATWPFDQVGAPSTWDTTTGSDVTVGIVDGGLVYRQHEDLNVVESIGGGDATAHATHVAGLACAEANGIGVVGVAWGCPIVTSGIGDGSPAAVLEAATKVAESGAQVINMSLGYQKGPFCHSAAEQQDEIRLAERDRLAFRQLFQGAVGRDVVWTISAGNNCARGVPSPWGLNADLPNVITVAATNDDYRLASFSDFGAGVEVAAPGGVSAGDVGIWSTWVESCGPLGLFSCGSYATDYGTSMAAPVVAGIAALVRSANPTYGAAETATCIVQNAGLSSAEERSPNPASRHPVVSFSMASDSVGIVDAFWTVRCVAFDPTDAGAYVGTWMGGSWILDVSEESPGVLGAVNEAETDFGNGCQIGPGLRLMTGLQPSGTGQWNGFVVSADSTCATVQYNALMALRAVWAGQSQVSLVLAWAQNSAGTRPAIGDDGTITSDTPYYSLWLTRPSASSAAAASAARHRDGATGASVSVAPAGRRRGFAVALP